MDFASAYNLVTNTAQYNNAWSAEQAAKQMEFQERMSNTAHQREVADLQAAGLNPVLSAKLGGASTPSGASASADTSLTGAVLQLAQQAMEASTMSAAALGAGYSSSSKTEIPIEEENTELPKFKNPTTPGRMLWNYAVDSGYGKNLAVNLKHAGDRIQQALNPSKLVEEGKAKGVTKSKSNSGWSLQKIVNGLSSNTASAMSYAKNK